MKDAVLTAVASAAAVGFLWWLVARVRCTLDRRKLYRWLHANTRDEPGETHVSTEALSKGTRLPAERVRRACMSDHRVLRLEGPPEQWSVWRAEPQSVYEKRGILEL